MTAHSPLFYPSENYSLEELRGRWVRKGFLFAQRKRIVFLKTFPYLKGVRAGGRKLLPHCPLFEPAIQMLLLMKNRAEVMKNECAKLRFL